MIPRSATQVATLDNDLVPDRLRMRAITGRTGWQVCGRATTR